MTVRAMKMASTNKPVDDLFANSAQPQTKADDTIRIGIGGWTYAPWRGGVFYPTGLVQRRELEYASRRLNSIEINGTYYGAQKPATYAKWRDETPPDFLFSAKAPQRIMESRRLSATGHQIEDFIGGIAELGEKLGPLVWQFDKGRKIEAQEFAAFLALLASHHGDRKLRHVLDVRDPDFISADYLELARSHGMATVFTDSEEHPSFADLTTDFVYARLMRSRADIATGYADDELQAWEQRTRQWAQGDDPAELPHVTDLPAPRVARQVFLYFISSAKERNPSAAMALLKHLGLT